MKKFLCRYFIINFFLVILSINYSFADYAIETDYRVDYNDVNGAKFFSSNKDKKSLEYTAFLEFFPSNHDIKLDLNNKNCRLLFIPSVFLTLNYIQNKTANDNYYDKKENKYVYTICGAKWLTYGNSNVVDITNKNGGCGESNNCNEYSKIEKYYPELGNFNGSYKFEVSKCLRNKNNCDGVIAKDNCIKKDTNTCVPVDGGNNFTINDRIFRENLYDGEEIINYGGCKDPRPEAKEYDVNRKNYKTSSDYPPQLYYMRGYNIGNYACERFLKGRQKIGDDFDQAYKCCQKASRSVCIYKYEKSNLATFCPVDSKLRCRINDIEIEIYKSNDIKNEKYCARTYNFCPYNFNIESGTELTEVFKQEMTEESLKNCENSNEVGEGFCDPKYKADACTIDGVVQDNCYGNIKNFYQYNRHCVILGGEQANFTYSNNYSPFIDKSCLNFIGSSHNSEGYKSYKGYQRLPNTYKFSFSAPAVECFTETMKNFLFNRAGHTSCLNSDESPNDNGVCESEKYNFREGQSLIEDERNNYKSPLNKLLLFLHDIIMVALALMITLYGYNVLIKGGKIGSRTDLVMMLIKITIIITLTNNTFWYKQLFKFTYALSNTFSSIVSKIGFDTSIDEQGRFIKDDGCFFGDINSIIPSDAPANVLEAANIYNNNYDKYPPDRKYISFFDTLDCKMAKYLGISNNNKIPNLFRMIMSTILWPFNIGIYLSISVLLIGFFVFNFIVKTVYIFIAATVGMTILLFLSPLIIPTILFEKTKGIFDKWLRNLLGFAMQPMILIAYVSISIMILDNFMLGEGLFVGSGPSNKKLICGFACISNEDGRILNFTDNRNKDAIKILHNYIEEGKDNSYENLSKEKDFQQVFIQLAKDSTSLEKCEGKDKIIDIKRHSPLCIMDNIVIKTILIFIPSLSDIYINDVIMYLRVLFLVFILNAVLNTVPGIAASLSGGSALPGTSISTDPFTIAGKIINFSKSVKRNAAKIAVKVASHIPASKAYAKIADKAMKAKENMNKRKDN